MNANTLVSCHCYEGDSHQVRALMPWYNQHRCPVVVVSPDDSRVTEKHLGNPPGVDYLFSGLRAYIGWDSLERQKQHLTALLARPYQFFLMHDSDSVCVTPEIPAYAYAEPDVLWSGEVSDSMHTMPAGYSLPRLAFHPPYFCSRQILAAMVEATKGVTFQSMQLPYIDHYMMRLAVHGGIKHQQWRCRQPKPHERTGDLIFDDMMAGRVMFHPIKRPDEIARLAQAQLKYEQ